MFYWRIMTCGKENKTETFAHLYQGSFPTGNIGLLLHSIETKKRAIFVAVAKLAVTRLLYQPTWSIVMMWCHSLIFCLECREHLQPDVVHLLWKQYVIVRVGSHFACDSS
jgi:hypothetical protein